MDIPSPTPPACAHYLVIGLWCANAHVLGYHKLHDDYFDREVRRTGDLYKQAVQAYE